MGAVLITVAIHGALAWVMYNERAEVRACGWFLFLAHVLKDACFPRAAWPRGSDAAAFGIAALLLARAEQKLTMAIAWVMLAGHARHLVCGDGKYYAWPSFADRPGGSAARQPASERCDARNPGDA